MPTIEELAAEIARVRIIAEQGVRTVEVVGVPPSLEVVATGPIRFAGDVVSSVAPDPQTGGALVTTAGVTAFEAQIVFGAYEAVF